MSNRFARVGGLFVLGVLALVPVLRGDDGKPGPADAGKKRPDEINHALAKPIQIDVVEMPLKDLVALLSKECDLTIQIDAKGLEKAHVHQAAPMTVSVAGLSLRSTLQFLLEPLNLRYIVRDGVVVITDEQDESPAVTKVYTVGDLVSSKENDMEKRIKAAAELVSIIDRWVIDGHPRRDECQVELFPPNLSFVATCPEDTHDRIARYIEDMRRFQKARDEAPAPKFD